VRLLIDGDAYHTGEAWGGRVDVTPVLSSTGLTELLEFSITNLGSVKEIKDQAGNVIDVETKGLAREDGDGVAEHEILITITPFDAIHNNAFVWDASELASGITFNPPTLAAARLQATPPS
jgi:hypothetical protein